MAQEKNRKSEAQERFEQAENAGRFAGNDADAQAARQQAKENVRQDTNSSREERNDNRNDSGSGRVMDRDELTTGGGEAQNVMDEMDQPLSDKDIDHARNKANEGQRQDRSEA